MDGFVYFPDNPNLKGSLAVGNGLRNLTHASGEQGKNNIAVGGNAGLNLTTGKYNVLIGENVGLNMTAENISTTYTGSPTHGNTGNVSIGQNSMVAANGALDNTGVGVNVLQNLTTGMDNAAIGINALQMIEGGSENVATGHGSLQYLVGSGTFSSGGGHRNSAHGDMAGRFLNSGANKTGGKSSVYVGAQTTSFANNVVNENVFGYDAEGRGSNTVSYGSAEVTAHFFNGGSLYLIEHETTDKAPNAHIDSVTGKVTRSEMQIDAQGIVINNSVTIANGQSAALPSGAGFLIMIESSVTGEVMDITYGGATYTPIRQSGSIFVRSNTPSPGQIGVSYDATSQSYRIYNNHGGQRRLDYTLIKMRGSN